jgi:hypothetical protein
MNPVADLDPILLILITLWTLPWKGVALWRATKRNERNWFIALLILNTLAILEIVYIFFFSRRPPKSERALKKSKHLPVPLPPHPEKEANKEKIIDALKEWKKINPETVSRLLNVSDSVAALYLEELTYEKKIKAARKNAEHPTYLLN